MKHDWMGEVFLYQASKEDYNEEERTIIKNSLKDQMSKRLRELSEIHVKVVNKINNL